jgi:hypothetical protein
MVILMAFIDPIGDLGDPGACSDELSRIYESMVSELGDPNLRELAGVLLASGHDLMSSYQLGTRIEITHEPCGADATHIQVTNRFRCEVVNPFSEPRVSTFRTTVPAVPTPDGRPPYRLLEYSIKALDSGRALHSLGPEDVRMALLEETNDFVYFADEPLTIPGKATVLVVYDSQRIIPLRDTYMYLIRTRPVKNLVVAYRHGALSRVLKERGPAVSPKLTVVANDAKIKDTKITSDESRAETVREWSLEGWLLLGNGVVLTW